MADLFAQVQKLEQRVNELEREKEAMKRAKDVPFIESLKTRIGGLSGTGTAGVTSGNIDRSISLSGEAETIQVLGYPDGFLKVEFKGAVRNLAYYNNI